MLTDDLLNLAILIPLCPLTAFFLITFLGRKLPRQGAGIAMAAMVCSWLLMLAVVGAWLVRLASHDTTPFEINHVWLELGAANINQNLSLQGGYMVDSATAVLLFVVTTVGSLIFWFAMGYMEGDPWYPRFFAYLSLFAAAMLGVVISNSLLWFFMCWEIMGLCSYFLIGFWFEKPSAMRAAKKAFVVTRVGDVGFFIGILALFVTSPGHSLTFSDLLSMPAVQHLINLQWSFLGASCSAATVIALLIFCGSIGKSAQFPLHVWLPDAMEGPTPVSALIHAATMVAAGVFLVARMYPLFAGPALLGSASVPLMVVAGVGAFTALFAATMAVPSFDIKKVLAYSTISQLGYMFVGLGCFGYSAALFHLMTHAFFKALLFLGAGSIHHAVHTYDMREMGGLARKMPITTKVYFVGCCALSGVPFFSGFWSKDAIIGQAYRANGPTLQIFGLFPVPYYKIIFTLAIVAALLTAFYTFRMFALVFTGKARDQHRFDHARESAPIMTIPLIILAAGAALIGLIGTPFEAANLFGQLVKFEFPASLGAEETLVLTLVLFGVSILIVALGWWLAWRAYKWHTARTPEEGGLRSSGLQPAYSAAAHLWYMDDFYTDTLVEPTMAITAAVGYFDNGFVDGILVNGPAWLAVRISHACDWFDRFIVDGVVRVVAGFSGEVGALLRRVQQGVIQIYALIVFCSVFLLIAAVLYLR